MISSTRRRGGLRRLLLALAALAGFSAAAATPAYAQSTEINTDVGCTNSGDWMLGSGWTVAGGECVASNATRMSMLMQMNDKVKTDHLLEIKADVSGITGTGELRAFAGLKMPSAPAGTWVPLSSLTTVHNTGNAGLQGGTGSALGPNTDPEGWGAWRISCLSGTFGRVDPLVYPGLQAPHLHEIVGATNMKPDWTNEDFHTKAQSSCNNLLDPQNTVNKSAYWFPALVGPNGAKRTGPLLIYYKNAASTAACNLASFAGVCQNIPKGFRFTGGYKGSFNAIASTAGNCGPFDTTSMGDNVSTPRGCSIRDVSGAWTCLVGPNGEGNPGGKVPGDAVGSPQLTLQDMLDSGLCRTIGMRVSRNIAMQGCWDATNVDSPDHRAHVGFGNYSATKCNSAFPVRVPAIALLLSYDVDQDFIDKKLRLSSDEMAACYDTGGLAGCTEHWDYWEAWPDDVRARWYQNCVAWQNSCINDLGDGYTLKSPGAQSVHNFDRDTTGTAIFAHKKQLNANTNPNEDYGMSRTITANGSYTFYIRSVGDGVFGFLGMKNFSGKIDNIRVKDLGPAAKGPVTVTGN